MLVLTGGSIYDTSSGIERNLNDDFQMRIFQNRARLPWNSTQNQRNIQHKITRVRAKCRKRRSDTFDQTFGDFFDELPRRARTRSDML